MNQFLTAFLLVIFCFFSFEANSQTTFTGAVSEDWAVLGNWDDGIPAFGNNAVIPDGQVVSIYLGVEILADFDITNDGTLTNSGALIIEGTLSNIGYINNQIGATFENRNGGTLDNEADGVFDNYGTSANEGTLINRALAVFINREDGTLTNPGSLENSGLFINSGLLENPGIFTNHNFISNTASGTILNSGSLTNIGGDLNNGGILNNCSGVYGGNPPTGNVEEVCISFEVTHTISGCDADASVTLDLSTLHTETGTWSYAIDGSVPEFIAASLDGATNVLTIDFSASGTGSGLLELIATEGMNTGAIHLTVTESDYPYVTSLLIACASDAGASDGGWQFGFTGAYGSPVTVHYFHNAVFGHSTASYLGAAPYGTEQSGSTDASGDLMTLPSGTYWISGYTNVKGCFSPEPTTGLAPTVSTVLRAAAVPYILD
ncbi:MAG: hypothetical protein OSA78_03620 [Flavobacteriales bacterium]|nr:hypothetical protein [Flavobacteriales bacterium]